MTEYVSVKDRLPKDGEEVVVHLRDGRLMFAMRFTADDGATGWKGMTNNCELAWEYFDYGNLDIIDYWIYERETDLTDELIADDDEDEEESADESCNITFNFSGNPSTVIQHVDTLIIK